MDENEILAAYEADPLAFVIEVERRARRMRNAVIREWIATGWRRLNRKQAARITRPAHQSTHQGKPGGNRLAAH